MTGPDDELLPDGVPAFGDPAYDALRGELADLAAPDPMPAEVAAQLDDVLAGLAGSRTELPAPDEPAGAPVVPLRRRSRVGQRLLVAAAAVIVVGAGGVGLTQVLGDTRNDTADSLSSAADSGTIAPTAPEAAGGNGAFDDKSGGLSTLDDGRVLALTRADFSSQASTALADAVDAPLARVLKDLELRGSASSLGPGTAPSPQSGDAASPAEGSTASRDNLLYSAGKSLCAPAVAGAMTAPVILDGTPAVLVVFGVVDGVRHVEARACDGTTVLAAADLPQ